MVGYDIIGIVDVREVFLVVHRPSSESTLDYPSPFNAVAVFLVDETSWGIVGSPGA
jgi:hypothetical protein